MPLPHGGPCTIDLSCHTHRDDHESCHGLHAAPCTQVYTAEEKAALAMFNQEEAKRKEQQLTDQFKQLIQETIGEAGGDAGASAGQGASGDAPAS